MNKYKGVLHKTKWLFALAITGLLWSYKLLAQDQSPVSFANIAQKQVVKVDQNGNKTIELKPAEVMVPGDTVLYTSTFTNISNESVSNIVVSNPIPKNTQYIIFSAKGEATVVTFSIDGGKTFAAASQLTVVKENGQKQAAKPSDYTDIRWVYQGDLASGSASSVSFQVKIL